MLISVEVEIAVVVVDVVVDTVTGSMIVRVVDGVGAVIVVGFTPKQEQAEL